MKHREIFDIHTHILPGVDDGSGSMKTTMEMLRIVYSQGVCAVMATPHGSLNGVSPALPQTAGGSEGAGIFYILTEYPYTIPYRELVWARYRPILAHIERYLCLRDGDRAEELSECGAYRRLISRVSEAPV